MAEFQIKPSANSEYYFNLLSTGNHKVILKSETYTTKSSCENGISSVKQNAPVDSRYEKLTARNGQHYFNLKAANGQVIGTSEMYVTEAGRDSGIDLVKEQAPTAGTTDLT
jgi:uncharacterized protein YegP (UPF0339 family)